MSAQIDYAEEAKRWLEKWIWGHIDQTNWRDKKFPQYAAATDDLAALLERVSGEAREEGLREQREKTVGMIEKVLGADWMKKSGLFIEDSTKEILRELISAILKERP